MKMCSNVEHKIMLQEKWISNGTGGIDPVIEPDPANVQEPLIGAFKPVEQLLGRDVGYLL
jgi:hypothetical protein